jgi:hypothetical protein
MTDQEARERKEGKEFPKLRLKNEEFESRVRTEWVCRT